MKINIVGGGPAGLYFGLLMKKLDPTHEIHIFERDPADNTYGWGIVLSRGTLNSLRGADFESYVEMMDHAEFWSDVDIIHKEVTTRVAGNDFVGIKRIQFLNILQERCRSLGVNLSFEHNISNPDEISDCDLIVGADGLKSMVREVQRDQFLTKIEQRHNKYIWYGTSKSFNALTMMFRPHEDGLYIAHAYKFEPTMSTFIVECDESTWKKAGFEGMSEDKTAEYLETIFEKELDHQPLLGNRSLWNNFLLVRNVHWFANSTVLLGDALHSVHFSIGSGTKLAVEDAIALVGSFAHQVHVADALVEFEKRRKPRVDAFQDAALDSLIWLENANEDIHLEPLPFSYKLMRRSNRVSHRRLIDQDPEFMDMYEAWRSKHEGPIHGDFLDLFQKKAYAHLATLLHDGKPHVTPLYADYDGEYILVNSAKGRQKDLNMERRRYVALEITDPEKPLRYLGIRGEVVDID
jgi:anthraniloyl-CoA monooxygenase